MEITTIEMPQQLLMISNNPFEASLRVPSEALFQNTLLGHPPGTPSYGRPPRGTFLGHPSKAPL